MEQLDLENNWTQSGVGGVVHGFLFFIKEPSNQPKSKKSPNQKNPKKTKKNQTRRNFTWTTSRKDLMKQQQDCNSLVANTRQQAISSYWLPLSLMASINKIAERAITILNQMTYPSHLVPIISSIFFFFFFKEGHQKKM